MLRIMMLRHGKTDGSLTGRYIGKTDEPLMPEEAAFLGSHPYPEVQTVFVSPHRRCLETASLMFPEQRQHLIPEFRECDFGFFEGRTYDEILRDPEYADWSDPMKIPAFPGGERIENFRQRCLDGFKKAVWFSENKHYTEVAMVVPGNVMACILNEYGFPKLSYEEWTVNYAEGYHLRLVPSAFIAGNTEIVVDGRFVRYAEE